MFDLDLCPSALGYVKMSDLLMEQCSDTVSLFRYGNRHVVVHPANYIPPHTLNSGIVVEPLRRHLVPQSLVAAPSPVSLSPGPPSPVSLVAALVQTEACGL
eukprot:Platyproteum_vivax@DN6893_c0_g1_i1.p1